MPAGTPNKALKHFQTTMKSLDELYEYRKKMKDGANPNREEFDKAVAAIGAINRQLGNHKEYQTADENRKHELRSKFFLQQEMPWQKKSTHPKIPQGSASPSASSPPYIHQDQYNEVGGDDEEAEQDPSTTTTFASRQISSSSPQQTGAAPPHPDASLPSVGVGGRQPPQQLAAVVGENQDSAVVELQKESSRMEDDDPFIDHKEIQHSASKRKGKGSLGEPLAKEKKVQSSADSGESDVKAPTKRGRPRNSYLCPHCDADASGGSVIECRGCRRWYHFHCVGLTADSDETKRYARWRCATCKNKTKQPRKQKTQKKVTDSESKAQITLP
jgi:hypothetical protein